MTLVELDDHRQPTGGWASREARNQAAMDMAAAAQAAGEPMTGAALGREFVMSERWGRDILRVLRELTEVDSQPAQAVAAAGGRPIHQPARRHPSSNTRRSLELRTEPRPQPVSQPDPDVGPRPSPTIAPDDEPAAARPAWLDRAITYLVAAVAALASYGHMREVALLAGEPDWIAWLWPLTVDGLAVAALRKGDRGRWWLLVGLAVSVAANVLTNYPDVVEEMAWAIKAWPPLALLGTHCLLQRHPGRAT